MSILATISAQLTANHREKLGLLLGETPERTDSLIQAALPVLTIAISQVNPTKLSALIQKTSSNSLDSLDLENSKNVTSFLGEGSKILVGLLGDQVDQVIQTVSDEAQMPRHAAASMLKGLAPMVLGAVGSGVVGKGSAVAGLGSVPAASSVTTRLPWAWWVFPLITIACLYFLKGFFPAKTSVTAPSAEMPTIDVVEIPAVDSLKGSLEKVLPSGIALAFDEKSIENEIIQFIENPNQAIDKTTWFNFRNLQFKTGSTELDDVTFQEVRNLAEILRAYPEVNIKVGGYTDATGNEKGNLTLSAGRAERIVQSLIGLGIDPVRLTSEGYGSQHPVASNDTEEGRGQNRRIAVRVTQK